MNPSLSKSEANRQLWRERINAWKSSNQSQKAFCKAHHLGYASFRRWRQIFKAEESEGRIAPTKPTRFLSVSLHESTPANLTVRLHNDLCVEVPEGFSPQLLQQVIQVLRAA